ncbi:glutathione peroxidase [Planococcus halotolerans]|uniref:glutathione peroxidase n=1 Tax=Planococcus halotolerans TaxID=2233542 RepID=UPI0010921EA6|nr:glutathione peroxidase [Planococcus halotolerans]QHJ69745.1 redoxin domain-containing protein [Planococcus halotolerans]
MVSVYDYKVKNLQGEMESLEKFKGNALVIVNTASKCGLTPQFEDLQKLYEKYSSKGFQILGFPSSQFNNQEFENQEETMEFCQMNYGVTFPMFAKTDVKGANANPLFTYLTSKHEDIEAEEIAWNFAKFLIDKEGHVIKRYSPQSSPLEIEEDLKTIL